MRIETARKAGLPAGALLLVTAGMVALDQAGIGTDTAGMTALFSAVLLVVGMPHGSFDLALLRRAGVAGNRGWAPAPLILLYIGCAGAMYLAWLIAPMLALTGFLLMAIAHFAEDWLDCGSPFIAGGIAAAVVAAPAVFHAEGLRELFVTLAGEADAALLADALLLVAPTAIAVALVGVVLLWQGGHRHLAASAGSGLIAMLLLPPVTGFALFFCLVHSPIQFRNHADALQMHGFGQWRRVVVPITLGGLGVAGAIFGLSNGASLSADVFTTSFITLSALTVPHMLVPMIVERFGRGVQQAPA